MDYQLESPPTPRLMMSGRIQKAEREGRFRMHWPDGWYSDFPTRNEALTSAAGSEPSRTMPIRLEDWDTTILEGNALEAAVRTRAAARDLYETIRLDARLQELEVGLNDLGWEGDNAHFHFSGQGQQYSKQVTREALLAETSPNLANAVIKELRVEIGFRRGE